MVTKTTGTKEWASSNINFCLGCSNDCLYCYAKAMSHRFNRKSREDWKNMELIEEMANKKFRKREGWIMSPSSHDITLENIDLAVAVFKNILEPGNKLLIVTKPDENWIRYLHRNLFLYLEQILFRFTITTLDDSSRYFWEPDAPNISSRFEALKLTYDLGFQTSISIEPFLDDTVVNLVKTLHPYVTDIIWIGPMNTTHVSKKYKEEITLDLYSSENLLKIKRKIDSLGFTNIRYKDHFLNKIKELV